MMSNNVKEKNIENEKLRLIEAIERAQTRIKEADSDEIEKMIQRLHSSNKKQVFKHNLDLGVLNSDKIGDKQ